MSIKSRLNRALRNRMYSMVVGLIKSEIEETAKSGDTLKLRILNTGVELDLLRVKNLVLQSTAKVLESQITKTAKGGPHD
jgi:hypothetical protein